MATLTTTQTSQLREVYLCVFDLFAATPSDIAAELEITREQARHSLAGLRVLGLCDDYDVNGEAQGAARRGEYKELVWQCWQTYDSISREEAERLFEMALQPERWAAECPVCGRAIEITGDERSTFECGSHGPMTKERI